MDRRTEYRDGVLYLIAEDGMAYPMAEVMKYNNPSMDFDPATGDPLGPAAPPAGLTEVEVRAGAKTEPQRRRDQDTFGDTTMRMAAPYLDSAIELAANAGRRPTYFSDPIMGGLERAGQYTGDMALAALSGLGALTYGGAGFMGEVFGGSQSDERMLARDLAAGIDVAGVGPEARALGLLSDAVRAERGGVGNMTRGFLAGESGSVPLPFSSALPAPRNEAEAIAKEILELRATGNVDAVTDSMMDAADPQYMYTYTPLAMDEASRLARAREIGFGNNRYHGNNSEVSGFIGSVFSSDNPTVASTYNRGMLDAQIYPIMVRGGPMGDVTVEGAGSNWNQLSPKMVDDIAVARTSALYPDEITGKLSTRGIERAAKFEGRSGVTFKDISDLGPGFNSQQFKRLGYTPEQEAAMRQQYLTDLSKPSEVDVRLYPNLVRSRFARFDPMFAHLRNLSAGIAPFGLLALQPNEEQY